MAPHQQATHTLVGHSTHKGHAALQAMLCYYSLQQGPLGSIAANQELRRAGVAG